MRLTETEKRRRNERYASDPEFRAKRIEASRARYAKIRLNPEWRERLRTQGRAASKSWRQTESYRAHKKRVATKNRERWKNDPEYRRKRLAHMKAHKLKSRYGVTKALYAQMFDAQGGVCALCGKPPVNRRLAVDHCHRTGMVRGLLHVVCNLLIGSAGESPELLRSAADYVERVARKGGHD